MDRLERSRSPTGRLEAAQRALQRAETSLTHARTVVDRLEHSLPPTGRVEAAQCALQRATYYLTHTRTAVGFAQSSIQDCLKVATEVEKVATRVATEVEQQEDGEAAAEVEKQADGEAAVEVKKQEDGEAAMQVERQPWPMASGASSADSIPLAVPGSGEWVNTESGALRAWYVCLQDWGGQYPPCGTVMPAKQWKHKFENIGASKQKWYCVCCAARLRTPFRMLVEVRTKGVSSFMLGEVTNKDVEDVRAMYMERFRSGNLPDPWQNLPDFTHIDPRDMLRSVEPHEIAKEVVGEGFDASTVSKFVNVQGVKDIPKWDWDQILSLLDGISSL